LIPNRDQHAYLRERLAVDLPLRVEDGQDKHIQHGKGAGLQESADAQALMELAAVTEHQNAGGASTPLLDHLRARRAAPMRLTV
jgi:hypothetical protein